MPYAQQTVTPELILSRMTPGKLYVTHRLADKLRCKTVEIRGLLTQMVEEGKLAKIRTDASNAKFFIAGTYSPPESVAVPTADPSTIAGRRAPPPLDRDLTGYGAEIAQRVALCMLTRGGR